MHTRRSAKRDPSKGPSVIAFKGAAGCLIPWHWHTPTEQVMIVSGSMKLEMKDGRSDSRSGWFRHASEQACASGQVHFGLLGVRPFRCGVRYPLRGCERERNHTGSSPVDEQALATRNDAPERDDRGLFGCGRLLARRRSKARRSLR
jgi:hypothetical protein